MALKDYQKHIRHTHGDKKKFAWCGAKLGVADWAFIGLDHAAYNALEEGRLTPCPLCLAAAVEALTSQEKEDTQLGVTFEAAHIEVAPGSVVEIKGQS